MDGAKAKVRWALFKARLADGMPVDIGNRYNLLDAVGRGWYDTVSSLKRERRGARGARGRRYTEPGTAARFIEPWLHRQPHNGGRFHRGARSVISTFFQNEPILKLQMYLVIRQLGKNELGFGRQSEPKLKGGKRGGRGENGVFWGKIWVRSRSTEAGLRRQRGGFCPNATCGGVDRRALGTRIPNVRRAGRTAGELVGRVDRQILG